MKITDDQHRDWYIASLLPHLGLSLSQQKVGMQPEALVGYKNGGVTDSITVG